MPERVGHSDAGAAIDWAIDHGIDHRIDHRIDRGIDQGIEHAGGALSRHVAGGNSEILGLIRMRD